MYSSLAQFKAYIGIDQADTSKDTMLTMLLKSAEETLNHLCGVDSFDLWDYEENIDLRKLYVNAFWYNIFLKNKPVQSIEEINWTDYSGVKWTDYMVANQRRVIFKSFDADSDFWFVTIKYKAWYDRARVDGQTTVDDLPDDLKLMEMMIACGNLPDEMKTDLNIGVSSYKLWDEQITFGAKTSSTQNMDDLYFSFTAMLWKFKNFTLAV